MKTKNLFTSIVLFLFIPVYMLAQTGQVDLNIVYKIKQEGKTNSKIEELSFWMTDFLGPRLTASKEKLQANEWAKTKMEDMGLENVVIDKVREFDRGGWDNKRTYVAMTAPYYANFSATPNAWTGSTKGEISGEAVLLDIKSEKDFEKHKGQLKGKIVVMPSTETYEVNFEPLATRYTEDDLLKIQEESMDSRRRRGNFNYEDYLKMRELRQKISEFLKAEGVAVILNGSGQFNVIHSGSTGYKSGDPQLIPEINLPIEAHGRIMRLLEHKVTVKLEVDIQNEFSDSPQVTNVMGEIKGTDQKLKDEIVLIGAHFDSWHGGTGAADNASGCIVMMEAMRILKALDVKPRRTIRIALWGGEELGLLGSRGYVEKYLRDPKNNKLKPGFEKFDVYFNMDNGTGKFRGIYLQQNEMVRPIFEEWMKPFNPMGMNTIAIGNTGGTDHQSFDPLGLPAFQFIQDVIEYDRGYHTNMDTYERLVMGDLKQNAIIVASFIYNAAMRDEQLPRKPYKAPVDGERRMF